MTDIVKKPEAMEAFGRQIKDATLPGNVKIPETMDAFGQQIKEATLDNKLIVILFSAKWSRKCEYLLYQIASKLAADHDDVVFIVVETDDMLELQWEWGIDCFPTCILLKQERVVEKISGPFPNELNDAINVLKRRRVYEREEFSHQNYKKWTIPKLKRPGDD